MTDHSANVATVTPPPLPAQFRQFLQMMELEADASAADKSDSPLITGFVKITEAESEAEMWDSDELVQIGGRDIVDVEMTVHDFSVRRSSDPEIESPFVDNDGRQMYLLVTSSRLDTGEQFIWNTSAPLLVGKLFWLQVREMFPVECVIRGTKLSGSREVLKLKPIPKRAVKG